MHTSEQLKEGIRILKKEKNAIILAHYYQEGEIQDIADFIGDSLGLSQKASTTDADIIVFAGVHFMAETAKILNPTKKVLLPDLRAGCSLADSCPPNAFSEFLSAHPGHTVVTYVNCSAEIKAMSDIICTSANARLIIESIPPEKPVIFAPDRNLGKYLESITGRKLVIWDGACEVHEAFSLEKIRELMRQHPESRLVVHPESEKVLIDLADFVGSTTAMIRYIAGENAQKFIIATEAGILHQLKKECPDKILIPAPAKENNSCACSECRYMKMNSLEKLYLALREESPCIEVPEELRIKALIPLQRMFALSSPKKQTTLEKSPH